MRYLAMIAVLLFIGCSQSKTKYQITVSPSGQVYRLDTVSGEITILEKAPVQSVRRTKLVVGSFYENEKREVLRYVGDGKFEPRPPLSDFERKWRRGAEGGNCSTTDIADLLTRRYPNIRRFEADKEASFLVLT